MSPGSAKLTGKIIALAVVVCGVALWISPEARRVVASWNGSLHGAASKKASAEHRHEHGPEGIVKLTGSQITKAKIELAPVEGCAIVQRLTVPGTITLDAERVGRVAAKVVGTVEELHKRLGDRVSKGEVVAVLESREVADARSDYLAAAFHFDLQKTLYEREQQLFERKVSPEQQFLRARNVFLETELRVSLARQKLVALGISEGEIAKLSTHQITGLRHIELRAPLTGQIIEVRVDVGAPVGREGQESEIYVIADLSSLWIDLAVPTSDLAAVSVGQPVTIAVGLGNSSDNAKVIFISPLLNKETRSARVIAAIGNNAMTWRPGTFVTARIATAEDPADICVPRSALQTMEGEQVVFVRTEEGFEKREVAVGRGDEKQVEVVFGLDPGEVIATTNTFVLKAELGKSEAGHSHDH